MLGVIINFREIYTLSIGYTPKARWLSDLFNRVPKALGE